MRFVPWNHVLEDNRWSVIKPNNTQIMFASDYITQWKDFLMDQYVV